MSVIVKWRSSLHTLNIQILFSCNYNIFEYSKIEIGSPYDKSIKSIRKNLQIIFLSIYLRINFGDNNY